VEKILSYYKPDGTYIEVESGFYFDIFGNCQEYVMLEQFEFRGHFWALHSTPESLHDFAITHIETGHAAFREDDGEKIIERFKEFFAAIGEEKIYRRIEKAYAETPAFWLI
jgi:hypothetical protein